MTITTDKTCFRCLDCKKYFYWLGGSCFGSIWSFNLKWFIELSTPCGGSINYSGCIHVNCVDINK